jgi:hypothetical protein
MKHGIGEEGAERGTDRKSSVFPRYPTNNNIFARLPASVLIPEVNIIGGMRFLLSVSRRDVARIEL